MGGLRRAPLTLRRGLHAQHHGSERRECCQGAQGAAFLNRPLRSAGGRPSQPQRFYVEQLATMKERELKCLYVNFEHVEAYDQVRRRRLAVGCGTLWCRFEQAVLEVLW